MAFDRWLNDKTSNPFVHEERREELEESYERTMIQPLLQAAQSATNPIVANA